MNTQLRKQARNLLITSNIEKIEKKEDLLTLTEAWNKRCELLTEGSKLYAEGSKRYAGDIKLRTEGSKLQVEGNLLWINTVLRIKGNMVIKYRDWDNNMNLYKICILETGEVFEYKE